MTSQTTLPRRSLLAGTAAGMAWGRPATAQARPIRVGVLTDLTGPYRDNGGPVAVACAQQAAADSGLATRGVAVEIVMGDHQNKPDVGLNLAREWFDRESVDVIAAVNNSAIAFAINDLATARNKVHLATGAVSTDLTGSRCSPNMVHWQSDSWSYAEAAGTAVTRAGGRKWFFILADYATGHILHENTARVVQAAGGTVTGAAAYPFPSTTDFSSFLLMAQASGADVIAFCNAGTDLENCIKQAHEFGLGQTRLVGLVTFLNNVKALGLDTAGGLLLSSSFYWDLNDRTRSFIDRIKPKIPGAMPNNEQAATYGAVLHYLKAVGQIGAPAAKESGLAAVTAMKRMPTDDDCFGQGSIRIDGRKLQPLYIFQVKTAAESTGPWDYYKLVGTMPADRIYRPLDEGSCKFLADALKQEGRPR